MNESMHICYDCRGFFPKEELVFHHLWGLLCKECFKQKDKDIEDVKKL